MAEKKKSRKKVDTEEEKPTKEEYDVAKHLRFNCPVRKAKLVGMPVQCFYAEDAVETLMKSKWSKGSDALFGERKSSLNYLHTLLLKGLFHRAIRVKKDKDKDKKKKKLKEGEKDDETGDDEMKLRKRRKGGDKDKEDDKKEEEEKKKSEEKEKKKKQKTIKLDMHDHQVFVAGTDEIYVWIYDPTPMKTFIIGLLMVVGAIGLCLFPLWPPEVRVGIYYCSLAGATFVGVIIALIIIRSILFCAVWLLTLGKYHFWFLPNLTEDVGFIDSFKPLYQHSTAEKDDTKKNSKNKNKKGKKKDKDSDKEVDESEVENEVNSRREREQQMTDNEEAEAGVRAGTGAEESATTPTPTPSTGAGDGPWLTSPEDRATASASETGAGDDASNSSLSGDFELVQREDLNSM